MKLKMKRKVIIIISMLALVLAFPLAGHAAEPASPSGAAGPDTMQVEYRYAEGDTPNIQQSIVQYGQTYHLTSQSDPVLESTLPTVRTYTYRIDGDLTPDQIATIQGLGNIKLTPVKLVYQRDVDVEVVFPNSDRPQAVLTNDVDDIPPTWPCKVTSGTSASGYETKELERAGVTYQFANPKYDQYGLPAGYVATVVYRGIETYSKVGYYSADATFTTSEADGGTPVYIIVADYQTDALPPQVVEFTPTPTAPTPEPDANDLTTAIGAQGPNLIANILNGNVPLGGTGLQGVWSLLSMILSFAAFIIALIYAIGAVMKRNRAKMLESLDMFDKYQLAQIKRRGTLLRMLTVIVGVITILVWLFLEDFELGVVWIDASTIMVGVLFAVTIALCVLTRISEANAIGDGLEEENDSTPKSA